MADRRESYYDEDQTRELCAAVDHGLPIGELIVMAELNDEERTERYPAGVPVFTADQMKQIRLGFETGLNLGDVLLFADPSYAPEEMEALRLSCSPAQDVIAETLEGIYSDDFEVTPDQVERHVKQAEERRNQETGPFQLDQIGIRLVKERTYYSDRPITSPQAAVRILGEEMRQYDRELVAIVNCSMDHHPLNVSICSVGTMEHALVSPRELLKTTILSNAASVILLHNHTSGDPTPSKWDKEITGRLQKVYTMMDIHLADHIIVGDETFYSFRQHGLLDEDELLRNEQEYQSEITI